MAGKLVNTVPGDFVSPFVPGRALLAGLRSTTGGVDPTKTAIDIASTALAFNGVLPESDSTLTAAGATASIDSVEKIRPTTGDNTRTITAGELVNTMAGAGAANNAIYQVQVPINPRASVLGSIKFRIDTSWSNTSPSWCNLLNLKGFYFGLEHGPLNTAAYVFLRDDGTTNGTLVVGGPQASPGTARPGQIELSTLDLTQISAGWKTLANGSVLELFILFNTYTNPYTVELWVRRDIDNQLIILKSIPVSNLGNFAAPGPSAQTNNTRTGPTNQATLFFGFQGASGEVLKVDDWALYPDYRKSVAGGTVLTNGAMNILPNGPCTYAAADNLTLDKSDPARWLPLSDGSAPKSDLYYQPGKPNKALYTRIYGSNRTGYQRKEPRLETLKDGAMFEAVVSGNSVGAVTPMGIGIEDGSKSYRLLMIEDTTKRTLGLIQNDTAPTLMSSFAVLQDKFDWTKPQLIRLVVDRRRNRVLCYAAPQDGSKLTSKTVSQNLLLNSSFEVDSDSDGFADTWGMYAGIQTKSLDGTAGNFYDGLNAQLIAADGIASAPRIYCTTNRPFIKAGTVVTVQARMKAAFGTSLYIGYKSYGAATGGGETDSGLFTTNVATGAFQLLTYTFTTTVDGYYTPTLGMSGTPAAGTQCWIDAAQMELGGVATTYLLTQSELVATQTADETIPALIVPMDQVFPAAPSSTGRMIAGFLSSAPVTSQFNVSSMLYLSRYVAWEGMDNKLPNDTTLDPGIQFSYQNTDIEPNLVPNASFEQDANGDLLPDGWALYNNTSALEPATTSLVAGRTGGKAYRVSWSVANSSTKGILTNSGIINGGVTGGVQGGWKANTKYIVSFWAQATGTNTTKNMGLGWNTTPTVTAIQAPTLTGTWQQYIFLLSWGNQIEINGSLWITINGSGSTGTLDIDDVKVEQTSSYTGYAPFGGGGSATMSNSELLLTKYSTTAGSYRYFSQNLDLTPYKGVVVDFKMAITAWANSAGLSNAAGTDTGVGIHLALGGYLLQLRFFECGVGGKRIAIVPGNGSATDITNLTILGAQYSAPVDWTQLQSYRLVVKPYDGIKVYIGSVLSEPAIVVPWSGGFNLTTDASTPSLQFGHFTGTVSSTSKWDYVRWGLADGFDVSVKQSYPDGLKPYLFGSKFFSSFNFYEA